MTVMIHYFSQINGTSFFHYKNLLRRIGGQIVEKGYLGGLMTRLSGIDPQTRHESLSHDASAWIICSNTS
jgi:hypothetical protein